MKKILMILTMIFLLATAASASHIDFRTTDFTGANGADSFSTVSNGIGLKFTPEPDPPDSVLYWDDEFGFGVSSDAGHDINEIEGPEFLTVEFAPNVFLMEIHITKLFDTGDYLERGSYEINDSGTWIDFFAVSGQITGTKGELFLPVPFSGQVRSIAFTSPGLTIEEQNHEFAVAGVKARAVPIPGAAWLLGSGLVGLVFLRRRMKS